MLDFMFIETISEILVWRVLQITMKQCNQQYWKKDWGIWPVLEFLKKNSYCGGFGVFSTAPIFLFHAGSNSTPTKGLWGFTTSL